MYETALGLACGGDTACGTALGTYNSMLYGLCQFLSNPVMGTISDRIGRRPVLLFGAAADVIVFAEARVRDC